MQIGSGFCWLNGSFYREDEVPFASTIFQKGIIIREEMRTLGTRISFFREHYDHLRSRLGILNIALEDILTADEMHQESVRLINKNRYFGGNCLRFTLIHDPGHPIPVNHALLECSQLGEIQYILNRKGYGVGIYDDLNLAVDRFTGKFPRPSLLDYHASRYRSSKGLDDCILLNQEGHVVESIDSSIFLRIKEKFHTPPLKDGSAETVMRNQMIRLLTDAGDPVNDKVSIRIKDVEHAEEIMLVNILEGIRWVVAIGQVRYYNHTGVRMIDLLNEKAFERI
jgi:branched-chain amino acid aminotransferase